VAKTEKGHGNRVIDSQFTCISEISRSGLSTGILPGDTENLPGPLAERVFPSAQSVELSALLHHTASWRAYC